MPSILENVSQIKQTIAARAKSAGRNPSDVELLIVTKRQELANILPLLENGERIFGENRVQEASAKWTTLKKDFPEIELHLIGHLQSNKVKEAITLFNVIQSLDSLKLADKLCREEKRQGKRLQYYVEINMANEPQKSGIALQEAQTFLNNLRENYDLQVVGLMCIPLQKVDPTSYFKNLTALATENELPKISMGMSSDYEIAIDCGATVVRIGQAIFRT